MRRLELRLESKMGEFIFRCDGHGYNNFLVRYCWKGGKGINEVTQRNQLESSVAKKVCLR